MSDIAGRIKEAREAVRPKLSLAAVGAACNPPITAQSVHKWEKGLSIPSAEGFDTLSRLTGRSVKWFLYGVEDAALTPQSDQVVARGRVVPMVEFASVSKYLTGDIGTISGGVRANFPCTAKSFQTFIDDDANHPELQVGDSVIIDLGRLPRPGKFCLAMHNGEPVIRRYRPRKSHVELAPANAEWPTLEVEPSAVIGAVTEISRPH